MSAPVLAAASGNPLRDFYEDPAVPASSGPDRAHRQAEMLADVLAGMRGRARILDVGCGDGFATGVAAARLPGHHVAALDWSAPSLRLARARGLAVLRAGLDTGLPIKSASVDVVIMSEVIEHLVDTDSAVEEAHRVLKPGGSLLLSTPNLAAWYNRGLLAVGIQPVFSEVSLRSV
ncbi:MAG: class I SAM-dependent methyltransferase, partial [Streptosporangiaceae bacterium]